MSDLPLRDFYHFDEADLSANRSGLLTEKQTRHLKAQKKGQKIATIVLGFVLVSIAAVILLAALLWAFNALKQGPDSSQITSVIIIVMFLAAFMGGAGPLFDHPHPHKKGTQN